MKSHSILFFFLMIYYSQIGYGQHCDLAEPILNTSEVQVLYENDFNNQDWKGIKIIESTHNSHALPSAIGPGWAFFSKEDGYAAASTSRFLHAGQADAWMILPAIEIESDNVFLTWEAQAINPDFRDGYEVLVSTTGTEKEHFEDMIFEIDEESNYWQARIISLSKFEGETIHIAVRNNTYNRHILLVNNLRVAVGTPNEHDIRLVVGEDDTWIPGVNHGITLPGERHIDLSFQNRGIHEIYEIEVEFTVNGDSFSERYEDLNFPPTEKLKISSDALISLEKGKNQRVSIEITSFNSISPPSPENAKADLDFKVWPPIPEFEAKDSKGNLHSIHGDLNNGKIVVLDFFASNCGPCSASVPSLEAFYQEFMAIENNPLKVYGLTILPSDNTDEIINEVIGSWGGTYPKFKFETKINRQLFFHYDENHELGFGGIPLFVLICPNPESIDESEIIAYAAGFNTNENPDVFQRVFRPAYKSCVESLMTSNIEELSAVEEIKVFPNPSSGLINITLDLKANSPLEIAVFNALGQKVDKIISSEMISVGHHSFNWKAPAAGTYYVRFYDGDSRMVEQITIFK